MKSLIIVGFQRISNNIEGHKYADTRQLFSSSMFLLATRIRLRSHVTGYDSYPGKIYADRPCVHTFPSLSRKFTLLYPENVYPPLKVENKSIRCGEQFSELRHVWTACPGRMGKDKCECKAYPHKVCLDRNRVWLRVNKIGSLSRYLWMLFLSDETFSG